MDKVSFNYKLDKIKELVENNKYYDAIDLSKELLELDKDSTNYRSFNNGIEYYLYLTTYNSNIKKEEYNFKKLYDLYATSLMLIGKYDKAVEYFEKSLEINPFDSLTRFKYSDCFRLMNDLDNYFLKSNEAINYCYKASDFQRFYRNISEYYFRYENYVESLYMMLFSRYVYDKNEDITTPELFRIYDCLGKKLDPSIDAIMNFLDNKNINTPTPMIDKLNYIYNKIYQNDAITSYDILVILYELTNDNNYKVLIDKIDALTKKVN